MKRTFGFVMACILGLTVTASAQNLTPRQDRGGFNPGWAGEIPGQPADVSFALSVSPNPFTDTAVITYILDAPGHVRLNIYDSGENLTAALVDEYQDAGPHSAVWNASDRESGAFYCTLNQGDSLYTREITVLR